jgi:hypothetical protein
MIKNDNYLSLFASNLFLKITIFEYYPTKLFKKGVVVFRILHSLKVLLAVKILVKTSSYGFEVH